MTTPARPWPNNQKENRDRAAEEIVAALKAIVPLLQVRVGDVDRLQSAGRAVHHLHSAARWLERAGAPTLPDMPRARMEALHAKTSDVS